MKDNSTNESDKVSSDLVFITTITGNVNYYAKWKERTYGTGTASDPFLIYSAGPNDDTASEGDFNYYARQGLFASTNQYYFKQMGDITLSAYNEDTGYPTNSSSMDLLGFYDGNGFTINYLNPEESWSCQPLFGRIGNASISTSKIENLIVNVNIAHGPSGISGLCSILYGQLENIILKGTVYSGDDDVSGLTGYMSNGSRIYKCANYATITGASNGAAICGRASGGIIEECVNYGKVSAGGVDHGGSRIAVGGIVGVCESSGSSGLIIKNCYNVGSVISDTEPCGGIIGYAGGTTIENCYNISPSMTGNVVGGIIGQSAGNNTDTNLYFRTGAGASYAVGSASANYNSVPKTYAQLQNQSTYSGWTFGTAGVSTSGWVFVNKSITIDGSTVTISLPRLAWECL